MMNRAASSTTAGSLTVTHVSAADKKGVSKRILQDESDVPDGVGNSAAINIQVKKICPTTEQAPFRNRIQHIINERTPTGEVAIVYQSNNITTS